MNSKFALEGERKQITVLFADVKGSMELLADRDPEVVRAICDPVLHHMMEAVHRYEGTVNQVMGDGIMALFGAPLAREDHAVRACYAALRMQESINRYADEARRTYGVTILIRVGVNSGEVVVRAIGSDLRMDYTAVGQTTHLAARMEQLARPGGILLTSSTMDLAAGFIKVESLGPTSVKGLATAINVYELLDSGPARSRIYATGRRFTPFVGRQKELVELAEALTEARSGRGQVVTLVGEPGVGKSRLYREFLQSHDAAGCLVLQASSASYGTATAYMPVIDALRTHFQIDARDDAETARTKIRSRLLTLDPGLERFVVPVLSLLDVLGEDVDWQRTDSSQRRQRTLEAVKRLLLREAQRQPVIAVFEDLHWIDSESQAVLDSVVESLPTARVLLLVNHRPEYQNKWSSKTYYRHIRIDPLPDDVAINVLGSLLGSDPALAVLKRKLIARTEGNPLFLEETVRTLVESGALIGSPGAYSMTRDINAIEVSATVQAILAARIDRLTPEDKQLLQAAAVIGEDIPLALLQGLYSDWDEVLYAGVSRLLGGEFLYEARLFPDLAYTFKHGLIRQVAYASLVDAKRTALHARLVAVIELLYPDRIGEHVEVLARHAASGKLDDKAIRYLHEAGRKAAGRSAYRQAAAYFEEAIEIERRMPTTRDSREQGIDIRFDLRNVLLALAQYGRILEYLREAEQLAEQLGDDTRLGRLYSFMTLAFIRNAEPERAIAAAEQTLAVAARRGDAGLQVAGTLFLGLSHYIMGSYSRARELCLRNISELSSRSLQEFFGLAALPSIQSRAYLVQSLAEVGEFDEGTRWGEEAIVIAEGANHPFSMAIAIQSLGFLYAIRGQPSKASSLLERALVLSRANEISQMLVPIKTVLGLAYVMLDRAEEGLTLSREAVEHASASGVHQQSYAARLSLACFLSGRTAEADSLAKSALELARVSQERGTEAYLLWILSAITLQRSSDDSPDLLSGFEQSLRLANELQMRPLVAHCHCGLAQVYRGIAKTIESNEHFSIATAIYRGSGMTYWLAKAQHAQAGR